MNTDTFTNKVNEVLVAARGLAGSQGHALIYPLHVLQALLDDREGIFTSAVSAAASSLGRDDGVSALRTAMAKGLHKIPTQEPPPDEIVASSGKRKGHLVQCTTLSGMHSGGQCNGASWTRSLSPQVEGKVASCRRTELLGIELTMVSCAGR